MYQFRSVQQLPISIEKAWEYFSSPHNLNELTPPQIGFVVNSKLDGAKMYPGMMIQYYFRPLLGIKLEWVSEITHVHEHKYFIDEQRFGPFALWHHQHHFKAIPGGVEITDIVDYKLPLGILGKLAHAMFAKKQLHQVFAYRTKVLEERFGKTV